VSRRALVLERPGKLGVKTIPELTPGPGEVLLRPAYCGLCGTDLELLAGEVDPAFVRPGGFIELLHEEYGVDAAAADAGTIGYEILTALGRRYLRIYSGAPRQC